MTATLADRLPIWLALPLRDLEDETHPLVRLWRACDIAELALRVVSSVAVSALPHYGDDLVRRVSPLISRPTLAQWLEIAHHLARAQARDTIVPELADCVSNILEPLLTKGPTALIPVRNQLAHGAGFSRHAAAAIIDDCAASVVDALDRITWLQEDSFWTASGLLHGPNPSAGAPPAAARDVLAESPGAVALVRADRAISLWPMLAFMPPETGRSTPASTTPPPPAPHAYARCGRRLELTALGSSHPTSDLRGDALRRFRDRFRLDDVERLLGHQTDDFWAEFRAEASTLVGRRDELAEVVRLVRERPSELLLIDGAPGQGKSALMARLALRLRELGLRVLAYRFRTGDPRATRSAFLRHVLQALDARAPRFGTDPRVLEQQAREALERTDAVLLLDGFDELVRLDPDALTLPLGLRQPGSVWVLATRLTPEVAEVYAPPHATRVFTEGLPPLDAGSISDWLKRDAPPLQRDHIVRSERAGDTGPWIEEVARRSGGLPAYVSLLVEDLRQGSLVVGAVVPGSLPAYFDDLLRRAGVDDTAAILPTILVATSMTAAAPAELVAVLRAVGQLTRADDETQAAMVVTAAERAAGLLRAIQGDRPRLAPFHEELREHLAGASHLEVTRAAVIQAWERLAAHPDAWTADAAVQRWIYANAISLLLGARRVSRARELLEDPSWTFRRLALSGRRGVYEHGSDWDRLEQTDRATSPWLTFWRQLQHRLAANPADTFWQLAGDHGHDSVVSQAIARQPIGRTWMRRSRACLPPMSPSAMLQRIPAPGSAGMILLSRTRLLAGGGRRSLEEVSLIDLISGEVTGRCGWMEDSDRLFSVAWLFGEVVNGDILAIAARGDVLCAIANSGHVNDARLLDDQITGHGVRRLFREGLAAAVTHVDGTRIAVASRTGRVACLRPGDQAPRFCTSRDIAAPGPPRTVAWFGDDIACVRPTGALVVWTPSTDRAETHWLPDARWLRRVFAAGPGLLLTYVDGSIAYWDGVLRWRVPSEPTDEVIAAAARTEDIALLHRSGVLRGVGMPDGVSRPWRVRTPGGGSSLLPLPFDRIAIGNLDEIHVIDPDLGEMTATADSRFDLARPRPRLKARIAATEARAVVCTDRPEILVWDPDNESLLDRISLPEMRTTAMAIAPDLRHVVYATDECDLVISDLATGRLQRTRYRARQTILRIALHPSGEWAATLDAGSQVLRWNVHDGSVEVLFDGRERSIEAIAFQRSGQLFCRSRDRVWSIDRTTPPPPNRRSPWDEDVAVSPSGTRLARVEGDAVVVSMPDGQHRWHAPRSLAAVAFTSERRLLAISRDASTAYSIEIVAPDLPL